MEMIATVIAVAGIALVLPVALAILMLHEFVYRGDRPLRSTTRTAS